MAVYGAQSRPAEALAALAEAARAVARRDRLQPTLEAVVEAAAAATGAELAVLWLRQQRERPDGPLVARAVAGESGVLQAELEGLRAPGPNATLPLLRARLDAGSQAPALSLPLDATGGEPGRLDLLRAGGRFDADDRRWAALAADLAALAVYLCSDAGAADDVGRLELVGDALSALSEAPHAAARIARVAALASDARGALLWTAADDAVLFEGSYGALQPTPELQLAAGAVLADHAAGVVSVEEAGDVVTLQLGQPAVGALQLLFAPGRAPAEDGLGRLAGFAVRAAHALRFAVRSAELEDELARSRALLSVVGEAIARLSLSHTLETAVDRLAELLGSDRAAVYLEPEAERASRGTGAGLHVAAERGLSGPHAALARALLDLALGPRRGRGLLEVEDVLAEPQLADVTAEARAAEISAAVALPLVVGETAIGLLAVYPRRPRPLTEGEVALLVALAAQLGVAVQNARLHEDATELGQRLERALESEQEKGKRLQALYDISRSFAQSLSLDTTLDELARALVTLLQVDAAVIRMPDERGLDFVTRAVHVNDERVDAAARALLTPAQPLPQSRVRQFVESGEALLVDAATAAELGGSFALLSPFLEKGSTAAVVPIVSSGDLVATLTIVSLHPSRPVAGEVVETALSITGQAALAIDNARLYAQQKKFADTMQRSLRPQVAPELPGLELGHVYEPSARVDVGGDVYDYLTLDDGRLAVVVGDVTGHGVDATADMAMAKFVFRSLAREHTDPGEFLAAANEVVASEIALGKFITLVETVIDAQRGEVACACGGHPAPRLVLADGTVHAIEARGLALGIDAPQKYETVLVPFPMGAHVVLYTDGVVEARRNRELYGLERFDELLSANRHLPPEQLALAALASCREWSDGGLTDDFAVVAIRRT